jgi:hypothetical protein
MWILCLSAVYVSATLSEHQFVACFAYRRHTDIRSMLPYTLCKRFLKFRKSCFVPDGLRDRERNSLTTVLMQVAVMRDNTYQLIRHVWNDVQEDWPFYSEQERQLLKRSVSHLYSRVLPVKRHFFEV